MRKIPVQPPDTDVWRRWIKDCKDATQANIKTGKQGQRIPITDLYKRDTIKKAYFLSRGAPFYGRCAYCECPIKDFHHVDIEHFRPKAGVTDEFGQTVRLKDRQGNVVLDSNGKAKSHPGYYWLAYDWQNLIPACTKCNRKTQDGNFGKHTRFPVVDLHAQEPGDERHEEPLLINPASGNANDDPENHLFVEPETGSMGFRTDRGAMCIKIFGLNVRTQLVDERKNKCDAVKYRIYTFWNLFQDLGKPEKSRKETWKKLLSCLDDFIHLWNGQGPYTMAARDTLRQYNFSLAELHQMRQEFQETLSKVDFGGAIAPE